MQGRSSLYRSSWTNAQENMNAKLGSESLSDTPTELR